MSCVALAQVRCRPFYCAFKSIAINKVDIILGEGESIAWASDGNWTAYTYTWQGSTYVASHLQGSCELLLSNTCALITLQLSRTIATYAHTNATVVVHESNTYIYYGTIYGYAVLPD